MIVSNKECFSWIHPTQKVEVANRMPSEHRLRRIEFARFDALTTPQCAHFLLDCPGIRVTIIDWIISGKIPTPCGDSVET
jgi:hypothetical protein